MKAETIPTNYTYSGGIVMKPCCDPQVLRQAPRGYPTRYRWECAHGFYPSRREPPCTCLGSAATTTEAQCHYHTDPDVEAER